ncbi:CDP-diacylglycerol--serine O-phosphatidyltransferase [Xylanibacter muris]|uniref:CDP-diacylglycerol--serine O-phosphatidyltransferase n=1 Tax=Xylanibacter muris TaxID=2736290 RepID=A0ABX2APE1_9BACT|nr:CDP-diacylglycerol--serine O-phosphatidyltransferase [Xylanibacter muris]NPD91897.1 CDP-diacylglycerol--serine O-phosphatidyltransferase [Xylanibacter muris]
MANSITKHIPNTITCCNLFSGCIAVSYAFAGNYDLAFLFIVVGAVFDFFDGMSARILGVSSPIGKELDSLADVVTFGVAPSAMVFCLLSTLEYPDTLSSVSHILPYTAFVIAAFSALRLAKFNLDERQTTSFIGLPTPANALFWASLITGEQNFLASSPYIPLGIIILILTTSITLIAEIPMFALKFKHWEWRGNGLKYTFVILCVPLLLIFRMSGFAVIMALYVILSVFSSRFNGNRSSAQG